MAEAAEASTSELEIECEIDVENGFWIAARAFAEDGAQAHTTPVYVVRPGLRFWDYESVTALVETQQQRLRDIEAVIRSAQNHVADGHLPLTSNAPSEFGGDTMGLFMLSQEGAELMEEVRQANEAYVRLVVLHDREAQLRQR